MTSEISTEVFGTQNKKSKEKTKEEEFIEVLKSKFQRLVAILQAIDTLKEEIKDEKGTYKEIIESLGQQGIEPKVADKVAKLLHKGGANEEEILYNKIYDTLNKIT